MYKYDQYDQAMVDARVEDFRDQVRRRIAGDMNDDQFKPLRLKNGLYLQLHASMLRVAIPYGTLNSGPLRKLAETEPKYASGHDTFKTRTHPNKHWMKPEDAPDTPPALRT